MDLGSTYTKAALLVDHRVVMERQLPTPGPLQASAERYEIDAEKYYQQVLTLIDAFLDEGDVQGILLSTQMHGYVLTDASFKSCTPYVSWRDQLGENYLPQLREWLTAADVYPSGVPLKGNLALCSLLARRAQGDDLPETAWFHTLGGYMVARLTGRHACHITNAAPTGMADIRRTCWNDALLKKTGLENLHLPEIVDDIIPLGQYRGVAVYPDIGDQQACAYGASLEVEHSLHVNVGTAGLMGALCQEFKVDGCESRPWLENGLYLRTVSGLRGGRHVQALRYEYPGPDEQVWERLTQNPDAHALHFYQEMAQEYRNAADRMDIKIEELCYSGGCVLQNPALRACIEANFELDDNCTKTGDIWRGMARLARRIEGSITEEL